MKHSPRAATAGGRGTAPLALEALLPRYRLDGGQAHQLKSILQALESNPRAPTSARAREHAVEVHLADSLVALELEAVRTACAIADIGSGAGFPGLALAVALPGCEVRLVESQARKCAFLEEILATADVENGRVACCRVEDWDEGAGAHDAVVARAVGPQPVVLEYAAPLLRLGGTLVDWRGRRAAAEEASASRAANALGMELLAIERVEPFAGARDHHLHVYAKVSETPPQFPRRAGIARKRPLGS